MGGGISDVDRGISPGSRATLLQQTGAPPPAVDTGLRMTGDAKRTTEKSDPFADLEGEANFIELNSQLSQAKTEKERNKISERLERWAAYYEAPDHRGEIYDIMTEFVLPSLERPAQAGADPEYPHEPAPAPRGLRGRAIWPARDRRRHLRGRTALRT